MIEKVFFDVTNKCNGACLYCFVNSNSMKGEELNERQITQCFNLLYRNGVKKISIGGGEPFLKNLPWIIDNSNPELKFSITSNGSILNDKIINLLKDERIKITISLDTVNKKNFEKVRKQLDFSKIQSNLDRLCQIDIIRKKLSIRATVTTNNIDNLIELVDFCEEKSIPKLKINSMNYFGRAKENSNLIPKFDLFCYFLQEIYNYSIGKKVSVELPIKKYLSEEKNNICTLGKNSMYVNSYGDVYPCAFSENDLLIGNILKSPIDNILTQLKNFDHSNYKCQKCPIHRYEKQ